VELKQISYGIIDFLLNPDNSLQYWHCLESNRDAQRISASGVFDALTAQLLNITKGARHLWRAPLFFCFFFKPYFG